MIEKLNQVTIVDNAPQELQALFVGRDLTNQRKDSLGFQGIILA